MILSYRPDIDGLRAIAVLAVVFFHIDHSLLPGGFAGVDIFFVISGFLITGIINKGVTAGSFSFSEFYRRRIKRIVPVLTCVVACSLIAGNFILLPRDLERLASSGIASQLFSANIYFTYFLDTSYFAADAALEPLLHLWSLGVEEQFYLFYPFLLIGLISIAQRKAIILVAFIIAFCSFMAAELLLESDPMFAYYMLPTRAWQLLAGALCFFIANEKSTKSHSRILSEILAWSGAAAVLYSLIFIPEGRGFPGVNALPVTIGAALIIISASLTPTSLARVLAARAFVAVGLISYSLYLWHWPVLAFLKYIFTDLTQFQNFMAFLLICGLSVISYNLIEKPFKRSQRPFSGIFMRQFLVPVGGVLVLSSTLIYTDGLGSYAADGKYKAALKQRQADIVPSYKFPWVCQSFTVGKSLLTDPNCIINGTQEPNTLLWGDSNGAHFVGAIGEISQELNFSFRSISHSSCPPILENASSFVKTKRQACADSVDAVKSELHKYKNIILAGAWNSYLKRDRKGFLQELSETIDSLISKGKSVTVLGKVPILPKFDIECELKKIKLDTLSCSDKMTAERSLIEDVNSDLRDISVRHGATYFDFSNYLCDANICSALYNKKLAYHDRSHLSMSGSISVGAAARYDQNVRAAFSVLSDQKYSAKETQFPLPWQLDTSAFFQHVDQLPRLEFAAARPMNDPASWRGVKPRYDSNQNSLIFEDVSASDYNSSTIQIASNDEMKKYVRSPRDFLVFDFQIEGCGTAASIFRFTSGWESSSNMDVFLDCGNAMIRHRGGSNDIFSNFESGITSGRFRVAISVSRLEDGLNLTIFPAGSNALTGYSKTETGMLVMTNPTIYMVNLNLENRALAAEIRLSK